MSGASWLVAPAARIRYGPVHGGGNAASSARQEPVAGAGAPEAAMLMRPVRDGIRRLTGRDHWEVLGFLR
ncbi:MAG: hypothetical protein KC635_25025, partial [Myxococcales bacterium]|nr:hypothetical protein [Myxococcales bacterium]